MTMSEKLSCIACNTACERGDTTGDFTVFLCPQCGSYKVSDTALVMLRNGTLRQPDPKAFRALVTKKRGNSSEYPLINSGDLGG